MRSIYVAVCGGSQATQTEARQAMMIGKLLAEAGAVVVTGGMGGVMADASRGAHEAGGTVVGILPTATHDPGNRFCTVTIPTGMGEARNAVIARMADAMIAIGGEYGTLSEIGLGLKMGRVVIGLDTWEIRRAGTESTHVRRAKSPEEAVRTAITAAKAHRDKTR